MPDESRRTNNERPLESRCNERLFQDLYRIYKWQKPQHNIRDVGRFKLRMDVNKTIMKSYSQNREDLFIANYFGDFKGTLLDIGANDGTTFSNSRLLIEKGWSAHLLEPGIAAFLKLADLYADSWHATIHRVGIGERDEVVTFYESGAHVKNGKDIGLVSTAIGSETNRWRKSGVHFDETQVKLLTWQSFYKRCDECTFEFISIDAEGYDWKILQQIDLKDTKVLCIEWNSDPNLLAKYTNYCKGFKPAVKNAENLIFVR